MPSQNQFLPGHKQKYLFFFISVTPKAKVAHTSLLSEFRGRREEPLLSVSFFTIQNRSEVFPNLTAQLS